MGCGVCYGWPSRTGEGGVMGAVIMLEKKSVLGVKTVFV